jgi:methyl-accepting chemotaxis protein
MTPLTEKFRNLPIGHKVTLVTVFASMVALLAVAGGLYAFQLRQFRQTFGNEMQTLARILAGNCAVPLAFDDPKTANEIISPLTVKPEVRSAAVLTGAGKKFAEFGDDNAENAVSPNSPAGIIERDAIWTVSEPIIFDGKRIGTLILDADFARPQSELRKLYATVTSVVLAGSLVIVLLLTLPLQRFITRPIYSLATASDTIAREHDYSLRVKKQSTDEIGVLTDAFNKMLGQIQTQDCALQTAQEELRQQLESLKREIAERERAILCLDLPEHFVERVGQYADFIGALLFYA